MAVCNNSLEQTNIWRWGLSFFSSHITLHTPAALLPSNAISSTDCTMPYPSICRCRFMCMCAKIVRWRCSSIGQTWYMRLWCQAAARCLPERWWNFNFEIENTVPTCHTCFSDVYEVGTYHIFTLTCLGAVPWLFWWRKMLLWQAMLYSLDRAWNVLRSLCRAFSRRSISPMYCTAFLPHWMSAISFLKWKQGGEEEGGMVYNFKLQTHALCVNQNFHISSVWSIITVQ